MRLTKSDYNFCMKACYDPRATEAESSFLSRMASMWAANEDITRDEYSRMQRLTGGCLSLETPIFDRPMP